MIKNSKQLFYLLLCVLILLLAGFFGVAYGTDNLLGSKATELSKLRADENALADQQTALARNKADIEKYSELNEIAKDIVPQDKDQAQAVLEIVQLASISGISKLSSITFPTSTLGTAAGLGTKTASPDLTQLTPVKGLTGVYNLEITIQQSSSDAIPYNRFIAFLQKLEQNRRTAQVTSINVQPSTENAGRVAFTLVINEYIKP